MVPRRRSIILDKSMWLWLMRHDSPFLLYSIQSEAQCSKWDWLSEALDAERFETRHCRYP